MRVKFFVRYKLVVFIGLIEQLNFIENSYEGIVVKFILNGYVRYYNLEVYYSNMKMYVFFYIIIVLFIKVEEYKEFFF